MATTGQEAECTANVVPPRDESDMVSSILQSQQPEMKLMKTFAAVALAGRAFAESLPSIRKEIWNCESEQLNIETLARKSEHSDPEVSLEINDLEHEFKSCIVKAKRFLKNCVEMAQYGNDDKTHKAIEKELNQGKLKELKRFIEILLKRLKMCKSSMDVFKVAYEETRQKAQNGMKKYKECVISAANTVREAKTEHFVATSSSNKAQDMQIASGIGLVAAFVIGLYGNATQSQLVEITAIVVGAVGVLGLVGARLYQRQPEIKRATEKITIAENVAQEMVFKNALKCSADLQKEMNKINHQIKEMWDYASQANVEVDSLTTYYLEKPLTLVAECSGILQDLKDLRSSMNSIQDELGPDGEKVSSNPNEVVRKIEAVQSTDDQETMNESNPLVVQTSPPQSIRGIQGGPPPIAPIPAENIGGTTGTTYTTMRRSYIPGQ